jgi:hypothetical protein
MLADDGQLTYEIMNRAVFKPTRLPGSIRYGAQDRGRRPVRGLHPLAVPPRVLERRPAVGPKHVTLVEDSVGDLANRVHPHACSSSACRRSESTVSYQLRSVCRARYARRRSKAAYAPASPRLGCGASRYTRSASNQPRGSSGIWEGVIENIGKGNIYKYHIVSRHRGYRVRIRVGYFKNIRKQPAHVVAFWERVMRDGDRARAEAKNS